MLHYITSMRTHETCFLSNVMSLGPFLSNQIRITNIFENPGGSRKIARFLSDLIRNRWRDTLGSRTTRIFKQSIRKHLLNHFFLSRPRDICPPAPTRRLTRKGRKITLHPGTLLYLLNNSPPKTWRYSPPRPRSEQSNTR